MYKQWHARVTGSTPKWSSRLVRCLLLISNSFLWNQKHATSESGWTLGRWTSHTGVSLYTHGRVWWNGTISFIPAALHGRVKQSTRACVWTNTGVSLISHGRVYGTNQAVQSRRLQRAWHHFHSGVALSKVRISSRFQDQIYSFHDQNLNYFISPRFPANNYHISWRFYGLRRSSIDWVHMLHSTINRGKFSSFQLTHSLFKAIRNCMRKKKRKRVWYISVRGRSAEISFKASSSSFCRSSKLS